MLSVAAALASLAIASAPATIHHETCPGTTYVGCYVAATHDIYLAPGADEYTRQHELGHAVDDQLLDPGERNAFSCLPAVEDPDGKITRCGGPWDPEVFADAYAACRLRHDPEQEGFETQFGYWPTTARRHLNACRFIARAAAD